MSEYKHGAYGQINVNGSRISDEAQSAIVYIGTAPVHQTQPKTGESYAINRPVVIRDIAEARKYFGYSDDWAKYTLCEPMKVHFEQKAVGPLVLINVLDPAKHIKTASATENKTPSEGVITLSDASLILTDTIAVGTKTRNTDYTVAVNSESDTVVITEKTSGGLGTAALEVTYSKKQVSTVSKTPSNNSITLASAEDIILESITVSTQDTEPVTKVRGTDYILSYNADKQTVTISGITDLGANALTITYKSVDATKVDKDDVIGATDGMGLNTGLYAIEDVYPTTGFIPAFIAAPGWSGIPAVHNAMYANSVKIGGHWDAYMFVDLPLADESGTKLTLATARTWKNSNGYTKENETVFFPMAQGLEDTPTYYHLSVLACANFQEKLTENDGIPYMTASNTECANIQNLYLGAGAETRIFTDKIINAYLNQHGIASAVYLGGRWVIWGCHSADYNQDDGDAVNVAETHRMMLYYVSNDFQSRRSADVDQPMTANDLDSIAAEEQTRLNALISIGALTFGEVVRSADADENSDIMQGDFAFKFRVTTTPIAKSLTAVVNWTDEGFTTYYGSDESTD